jgi:sialate O-acetylesterase
VGQPTLDSFTVSANQGGDGAADNGFIDGITSNEFANMTWFNNSSSQLPATNTVILDVTTNTGGYDLSEINSIAGWGGGEQADQILTVEYSVVGNAGFTSLGTFTNTAAGTAEYSRLNLTEESTGYLATGVDALRFTYAATGKHLVLQEIDVIGVAAEVVQPTVQLELASMFSDDMILQREKALPVWGTSTPGAAITVEFAGQTNMTTAASNGTWRVDLDPMVASTNARTLTVTAELEGFETTVVSFFNILVGEVWLFSGQSNMAFVINQTVQRHTVELLPTNERLRLFKVPMEGPSTPLERIDAVWTLCNTGSGAGTADDFSAVAYNFGIKLQNELESSEGAKDVPIGLIQSARGGSIIEKWLPAGTSYNGGAAGIHYNGMIDAIIPFAMRGVIWYQGENNVVEDQDATGYVAKKKTLIDGWRALWGYGFPFYYAQLAPYAYSENDKWNVEAGVLPLFWEAQSAVLGEVTNVGMAVASDHVTDLNGSVNFNEIHPRDKEPIAQRLALLALDNTYGHDIVSSGPVFQSLKTVGNTLEITFDSADGLTTSDALAPDWFELEVADGVYTSATAVVSNNMVVLSAPAVAVPTSMRFAWSQVAQPNLRNGAGLVASAFRAEQNLFGQWIVDFGLSGSNAVYTANPDGDALDNLGEYALGGNPTNDDASAVLPAHFMENPAGTNWLYFVHNERTDDPELIYTVLAGTNLVSGAWKTNGVEFAGSSVVSNGWKTVTNRTEAVEAAKFISLNVEL